MTTRAASDPSVKANPGKPRTGSPAFLRSLLGLWVLTYKSLLAWRRTPLLLGLLLANPLLAWFSLESNQSGGYLDWVTRLHLDLLCPLWCLVVAGAMIRDEVQDDTLAFLITRPLTRARLFLGKYLCHLVYLQAIVLLNSVLLTAVGYARGVPEALSIAGPLLLTGALATLAYSALGALFGLITRRYVVLGLVYGFLVEIGVGNIPTNVNSLSMMRHVHTLLGNSEAIHERYGWSPDGSGMAILIMLLATGLLLGAGAVLFTLREFHVSNEAPK